MLRHVVLLTYVDDATPEQLDALLTGLGELPAQIEEIRSYQFGLDVCRSDGNAHLAIVANFDDFDAYQRYHVHPAHTELINTLSLPILKARSAVQFEL